MQQNICLRCGKERSNKPSAIKRNKTGLCGDCRFYQSAIDSDKYSTIHKWLIRIKGSPTKCEECGSTPTKNRRGRNRVHWANIKPQYERKPENYRALCMSCHAKLDNIIKNIQGGNHAIA